MLIQLYQQSGGDTTATYGDPAVNNDAATYQVGTAAAYITTSSGANTVSIVWNSQTDESALSSSSVDGHGDPL